jgi:transposase-like protein
MTRVEQEIRRRAVTAAIAAGKSVKEVARLHNLSINSVYIYCRQAGIKTQGSLSPEARRNIARIAGMARAAKGVGHQFKSEDGRAAIQKRWQEAKS